MAFVSDRHGHGDILILDLASGRVRELATTPADELDPRWSPDGRTLAMTVRGSDGTSRIWIARVDADGGGERRGISLPGQRAYRARWAPDGGSLSYTASGDDGRQGRQVWLRRVPELGAGTGPGTPSTLEPVRLSQGPDEHVGYDWSPDGRFILVLSLGAESQDLWAWPVDGGSPRRLTDREGEEWWPSWSPDGNRVVFYTTWDDAMTDVWTAESVTGRLRQVTDLPVEDFCPAWSPRGDRLAFLSDRASKSGLWVAGPDGDEPMPVATEGRVGANFDWTPDGDGIIFAYGKAKTRLFAQPIGGGDPVALTDGLRNVDEARMSPDGRFIAFESDDRGSEADLFVLERATGAVRRLTDETDYNARPVWSPDGAWLAFEHSPGGGPRTTRLAVIASTGGTPTIITENGYVRGPVWCGDDIVYTVEHSQAGGGADQLWSVRAAGGMPRQLTTTPRDKRATDCTPDGHLLFQAPIDGGSRLWRARVTEGGLTEPVDLGPGEGGRWSQDGGRVAFLSTRDGQPDVYILSVDDGRVTRVTSTPVAESWPDWLDGPPAVIYSANPRGRDLWIAKLDSP